MEMSVNKSNDLVRTIVVVDDSVYVRRMVRFALSQFNFNIIEASDGADALHCIKVNPVDLVITDLKMPNMDGFELVRELRKQKQFKYLPIIMLTVEADEKNRLEAKRVGVSAFIDKPFVPEEIAGLIDSLFD